MAKGPRYPVDGPLMTDVRAALTDEFRGARAIWTAMGKWSPTSVRHALKQMADIGEAETTRVPRAGATTAEFAYHFRRARL